MEVYSFLITTEVWQMSSVSSKTYKTAVCYTKLVSIGKFCMALGDGLLQNGLLGAQNGELGLGQFERHQFRILNNHINQIIQRY